MYKPKYKGNFRDYDGHLISVTLYFNDKYDVKSNDAPQGRLNKPNLKDDNQLWRPDDDAELTYLIKPLTFAGENPVVIEVGGDASNVFEPLIKTTCTLRIVTNKLFDEIYTPYLDAWAVEVKRDTKDEFENDEVLFFGFISPNLYSQDFSINKDTIEVNCINLVGALQYIKISTLFKKDEMIAFADIFGRLKEAFPDFLDLMYCMDIPLKLGNDSMYYADRNIWRNVYYKVANFFDDNGEDGYMNELVEEILKVYNLTLIMQQNDLYVLDFSVIFEDEEAVYYHMFIDAYNYWQWSGKLITHNFADYKRQEPQEQVSINETYSDFKLVCSVNDNKSDDFYDSIITDDPDKFKDGFTNVRWNAMTSKSLPNEIYNYTYLAAFIDNDTYNVYGGDFTPLAGTALSKNLHNSISPLSIENTYGVIVQEYGTLKGNRNPNVELNVNLNKCITCFAPDNGTPPECWDIRHRQGYETTQIYDTKLIWLEYAGEMYHVRKNVPNMDLGEAFIGHATNGYLDVNLPSYIVNRVIPIYNENSQQTININLTHWFSRNGIPEKFSYANVPSDARKSDWIPSDWSDDNIYLTTRQMGYFDGTPCKLSYYGINDNLIPDMNGYRIRLTLMTTDNKRWHFDGEEWHDTTEGGLYVFDLYNKWKDSTKDKAFYQKYSPNLIKTDGGKIIDLEDEEGLINTMMAESTSGNLKIQIPMEIENPKEVYIDIAPNYLMGMTTHPSGYDKELDAPYSAGYIKADHIQMDVTIDAPDNNHVQLFDIQDVEYKGSISDIPYSTDAEEITHKISTFNEYFNRNLSVVYDKDNQPIDSNAFTEFPEHYVLKQHSKFYGNKKLIFGTQIKFSGLFEPFFKVYHNYFGKWFLCLNQSFDVKTLRNRIECVQVSNLPEIVTEVKSNCVPHKDRYNGIFINNRRGL